jgi:alkylated DNA nucleotide flippase Atl1
MTTAEVARATGQTDAANTHTALQALGKRGVLEHLADERPARWRLVPALRGVSDPYLAMAGHVRAGEWTTYGDISIAVRGDTKAARAVGRAAATIAHFPNPHRVLWSGGRIPPNWRSAQSADPNPDECRRRLEAEGIRFNPANDTASRDQYVSWDVLKERDEQQ